MQFSVLEEATVVVFLFFCPLKANNLFRHLADVIMS